VLRQLPGAGRSNCLGEEGKGFVTYAHAVHSINGRLGIAAQAVGIARAALEASAR
jgi:alkylation response protein AidB-like acyl-CoA dehydrogenase